jgi:hypothetical protein
MSLFGSDDTAEVAQRRQPRIGTKHPSLDVLVFSFGEVRSDFVVELTVDSLRANQCYDTLHMSP